jgi:hypothetical protein
VPTVNAPKKLTTLLDLCRSRDIGEISFHPDGSVALVKFNRPTLVRREEVDEDRTAYVVPAKRPPVVRASRDAVELAINGIDYDPDEVADLSVDEAEA